MSNAFPETVMPAAPLSKELEALLEFLTHQKPATTGDRELHELSQLSEKELHAKIRELENWNFRLNRDEARETQESVHLGLADHSTSSS